MQKIPLIILILFCCNLIYSQKKKNVFPKEKTAVILAKVDNITAEIIKNKFYILAKGKNNSIDTLNIKTLDSKVTPKEVKWVSFTTKNVALYLLTWNENLIKETMDKKEDITQNYSEIYEILSKEKVFSNVQTVSKIKEKVYLDKGKNASETQERLHNEGFLFTLSKNGDVILNSKQQETKWTFDPINKKYILSKKKN